MLWHTLKLWWIFPFIYKDIFINQIFSTSLVTLATIIHKFLLWYSTFNVILLIINELVSMVQIFKRPNVISSSYFFLGQLSTSVPSANRKSHDTNCSSCYIEVSSLKRAMERLPEVSPLEKKVSLTQVESPKKKLIFKRRYWCLGAYYIKGAGKTSWWKWQVLRQSCRLEILYFSASSSSPCLSVKNETSLFWENKLLKNPFIREQQCWNL